MRKNRRITSIQSMRLAPVETFTKFKRKCGDQGGRERPKRYKKVHHVNFAPVAKFDKFIYS